MKVICNPKGFTLLELVIVVAIISIVTGIVTLSSHGTLKNYQLRGAAQQVYSDMQLARLRSIKEGKACALEYSGTAYLVKFAGSDGIFGTSDDQVLKNEDIGSSYAQVSLSSSYSRTIFYPNGTSSGGTVTLDNGIKTRDISPITTTGNIRIQ